MVALNRAWELHDQLRAVAKINTQVVEEGKREEQAEEEAVKENVVEENAVAEEEDNVEEEPPVGMYEAEYRCIVGRFAKKLPALAAGGVQMAADPRKGGKAVCATGLSSLSIWTGGCGLRHQGKGPTK